MAFRFKNFDWFIVGGLLILAVMSLLTLFSSSYIFFRRQLGWYIVSFAIIILWSQVDWRSLIRQAWFRYGIYSLSVFLLVVSNLQSGTIRGTKSWITFLGFQFEPAEFAKLGLILVLAGFFSKRHFEAWQSKNIVLSLALFLLPAGLVFIQPDFGSAVTFAGIWISFFLTSGINKKRFAIGLFLAIIFAAVLWLFVLKPYQKDRIIAFLLPEHDPLGINYNVIQSKIAIGSAGFWGKGFGGGTQVRLGFLPAAGTDFVFAAFVEEWGVFGGMLLIIVFLYVVSRVIRIGLRAGDNYSKFIALGSGAFLIIHFLVNIGSNLGLLPVTGLTLPFVSYGGTNLLTAATLISIMEHIRLESR